MATTKHDLSPPSLEELARILTSALSENYTHGSATVEECPDLREMPFGLAAKGLTGSECAADIGGQSNLFLQPHLDKTYSMLECAQSMDMSSKQGFILGAGAGPFHIVGQNSELAPNFSWKDGFENVNNLTRFTRVDRSSKQVMCERCPSTDCALLMNLYGSSGGSGPVLKITARGRRGDGKSFTKFLQQTLLRTYGDKQQVTLGGVFLLKKGKANFHIMPDFPPENELPWADRPAFDSWLKYRHFAAPIVCLSVFHSCDPEGLGLRIEHTHCFSAEGKNEGGHYHYDLPTREDDAEEVEYEAYFNTAKTIYRIDKPALK